MLSLGLSKYSSTGCTCKYVSFRLSKEWGNLIQLNHEIRRKEKWKKKTTYQAPSRCNVRVYRHYFRGKGIVKCEFLNSRSSDSVDSRWNSEKTYFKQASQVILI